MNANECLNKADEIIKELEKPRVEDWNWKAITFGICLGFIIGLMIGGIFF